MKSLYYQSYSMVVVVGFYDPFKHLRPGVFNLLSSRANLHLSYNPAGPQSLQIIESLWIY